ncbi:hypothetical protein ACIF8T_09185 [Streptomyces sp. NPDC085946]|uniref:hypothetical protein n=1 Tax=Streptomyces sp. NPDC085946 TaxID=3365744 RepID=UPI0037CF2C4B
MAHTFDELVAMQRAADQAHNRVEELRNQYGSPAHTSWTKGQSATYETAWRAWRDLDRDARLAVTEYAKDQGTSRREVEDALRQAVRHPEAET